jgi:hypothetical protein
VLVTKFFEDTEETVRSHPHWKDVSVAELEDIVGEWPVGEHSNYSACSHKSAREDCYQHYIMVKLAAINLPAAPSGAEATPDIELEQRIIEFGRLSPQLYHACRDLDSSVRDHILVVVRQLTVAPRLIWLHLYDSYGRWASASTSVPPAPALLRAQTHVL